MIRMICVYLCRQAWQGNRDVMIDRYDVRTHIDYIAETVQGHKTYAPIKLQIIMIFDNDNYFAPVRVAK